MTAPDIETVPRYIAEQRTIADLDLGIVTGGLSPAAGGLFESVRIPANRLAQSGMAVSVYGSYEPQFDAARSAWQGPVVQAFPLIGPLRLSFTPGMLKKIIAGNHDLLHQHGIWIYQSRIVDAWRRRTGRPTIISPRGMLDPWALRNSNLKKQIVRKLPKNSGKKWKNYAKKF